VGRSPQVLGIFFLKKKTLSFAFAFDWKDQQGGMMMMMMMVVVVMMMMMALRCPSSLPCQAKPRH